MTSILGISAFYHDSAACLVQDGVIVAAAQEERFTRKKHDAGFPANAIAYCLGEAGITAADLDHVAYYDKPLLKFDRLLETWLWFAPRGFRQFAKGLPVWITEKLHVPRELDRGLGGAFRGRPVFLEHHESHAASAFYPSPFEEAAILTMDGVGEWATASIGVGEGSRIRLTHELRFPHSLGLLYSAFTYFTGFRVNSGEYKLMGLAPYGEPVYADFIRDRILDLKEDGSFHMDMSWFRYCQGLVMTSPKLDGPMDGPPRRAETEITAREMNIAASIQKVTEEVVLRMARTAHRLTGKKNLVLAGGVALNCVGNGRLIREGPFEEVWIQPAAGDAGGALGAALFVWHQLLKNPRVPDPDDSMRGSLLGPRPDDQAIATFLDSVGAVYERIDDETALLDRVARELQDEKVVGFFQDRMEFGPRALGSRSILGDARSSKMQATMNLKIKFRESFRPFAPVVLADRVHEWFEMKPGQKSPYMLVVAGVHPKRRVANDASVRGLARLSQRRSEIPAVTHVDDSARIQTVEASKHPRLHALLTRFDALTGCPVLINTSFNIRGEPIVCQPEEAWRCLLATGMDVLVLENFVLRKEDQPSAETCDIEDYVGRFPLD